MAKKCNVIVYIIFDYECAAAHAAFYYMLIVCNCQACTLSMHKPLNKAEDIRDSSHTAFLATISLAMRIDRSKIEEASPSTRCDKIVVLKKDRFLSLRASNFDNAVCLTNSWLSVQPGLPCIFKASLKRDRAQKE